MHNIERGTQWGKVISEIAFINFTKYLLYARHHILLLITNRSLLLTTNKGRIFLLQKVG